MELSQNKKNLLVLGGIVLLGFAYYILVIVPANSTTSTFDAEFSAQLQQKTEKFITHSAILGSLRLDTTIANHPALLGLVSYETAVPEQTVGKSNLFDEPATIVPLTE
jgi:hypothetical protein